MARLSKLDKIFLEEYQRAEDVVTESFGRPLTKLEIANVKHVFAMGRSAGVDFALNQGKWAL